MKMRDRYGTIGDYYDQIVVKQKLTPKEREFKGVFEALIEGLLEEHEVWALYFHLTKKDEESD